MYKKLNESELFYLEKKCVHYAVSMVVSKEVQNNPILMKALMDSFTILNIKKIECEMLDGTTVVFNVDDFDFELLEIAM